jgi:acyl carrier protein
MTPDDATAAVRAAITRSAPDVDVALLDGDVELCSELDLDSMDFLNVLIAIAERTGIEVPERDYPEVATFRGLVDYLTRT